LHGSENCIKIECALCEHSIVIKKENRRTLKNACRFFYCQKLEVAIWKECDKIYSLSIKETAVEKKEILLKLRQETGMNRREFAEYFGIPYRTVQEWELGHREMPGYLLRLMYYHEKTKEKEQLLPKMQSEDGKISIVRDVDGKNIVIINDIRFRGKRKIKWDEVEKYLREYVKKYYEIEAYSDKIYIGKDFPDEFAHSRDSEKLSGANAKAKANAAQAIGELIRTATNKSMSEDHENKHGTRAQNGWYRYDVRFGIPVYDQNEDLERYNIYTAKMLVRHDADGKLYLYDIIRTKKETSTPSGLL